MTSVPHPAHTHWQPPIFSPKMCFAYLPYKDARLYQLTAFNTLSLTLFLSSLYLFFFLLSIFTPHFPLTPPALYKSPSLSVCVSLAVRQTHGQSGYRRTEQTVTESVSGRLCCSWLISALSPLWFFNIKQLRLAVSDVYSFTIVVRTLTDTTHS